TPTASISASLVATSYCAGASGSSARGPTPLTRGSSRITSAGTPLRSARRRSPSHHSSGIGMAWLCTSTTGSVFMTTRSIRQEVADQPVERRGPLDLHPVPALREDVQVGPVDHLVQHDRGLLGDHLVLAAVHDQRLVRDLADVVVGGPHGLDPALSRR